MDRLPGGKDVTWVPTCDAVIAQMLDMVDPRPGDHLVDLGAGDGRLVIAAARRGATALGVEYDADKVSLARQAAEAAGLSARARFLQADLFTVDFSAATVLTLFLLPALNLRLRPAILAMPPGTRVATNTFDFADWEADTKFEVPPPGCTAHCWALGWTVPAPVAGTWQTAMGPLHLHQSFQTLTGTLETPGTPTPVTGRLHGREITLSLAGHLLGGEVQGDRIPALGPLGTLHRLRPHSHSIVPGGFDVMS